MKKNILFLLLVLFPLLASAVESKSGYVGDWIDLQTEYSSSSMLGDATWRITKGPYNSVDFPVRTGSKVSLNIISYFTETLVVEARYQLKNGQNKLEYFNVTCNAVTLNVTPTRINLAIGEKDYIQYTTSPYGKHPQVDYESTNKSVVTVSYAGEVLGKGEGSATIKVTNNMGPDVEIPVTVGGGGGGDNPGGGGDNPGGGGDNPGGGGSSDGTYFYAKTEEGVTLKFYKLSTYWGDEMAVARECILAGTNSVKGKITIPHYVNGISVTTIASRAFDDQNGLTELVLPSSIKKVYDRIITNTCGNLRKITCEAKYVPAAGSEGVITPLCKNIVLYVPQGCKYLYEQCTGWKDFGSIKEIGEAETLIEINATNFPDDNFRKFLLSKDYGADGVLTEMEISNLKTIVCISEGVKSFKGIEYFTSLEELYCTWNTVNSLDLSKNTKLRILECVHCGLTTLDLSQNKALKFIDCSLNSIKGAGMDNLINSLPKTENGIIYVTRGSDNICTKTQVAAAKAKGWTPYYYDGNQNGKEIWLEYAGVEQSIMIDATNFPDDNFRKYLLEQDYGKDGAITEEEIKKVETMTISSLNINSLKGIEFFTSLWYLSCEKNQLASLDVSRNTALITLSCYKNQIKTLDVSNNPNLATLYCNDNKLTKLDVSKNKELVNLNCSNNATTSLDVSQNLALTNIDCRNNQLTVLDVPKSTELKYIWCSNNKLTSLDVSKNSALLVLECFGNQLNVLNVLKNTNLTNLNCSSNELSILNVSKNTKLSKLWCGNNKLTSLDVSKNSSLVELGCSNNQIRGEKMDNLINSLPQNKTNEEYKFYVISNPSEDGNVCTNSQVAAIKAKGWTPYYYYNYKWVEYEGSDPSSIDGVKLDKAIDAPIYNLNGQRLDKPRKGIIIIGGKKILVK